MGNEPNVATNAEPSQDDIVKAMALVKAIHAQTASSEEKVTDPATRHNFDVGDAVDADGAGLAPTPDRVFKKGFLPVPRTLNDDERKAAMPAINRFPRGDMENFSMARLMMADYKAKVGQQGNSVYSRYAPWESQYMEACKSIAFVDPVTKATMGDMATGQDGGFLAPEEWRASLLDMLYSALISKKLPMTWLDMGTRVSHMPKITGAVTVGYTAENGSITASSPQFSQLSFTARKQTALVQLSNELIMDANVAVENELRSHITKYLAID